ncbi:MAG: mucoidy inhibitor MuiA family protein [Candidatus Heimdallarchaeota archaeon]|nr:mucoidy inhibitor MuiA family protein [Candidatus Heimdallarchaeota archaeon]
MDESKHTTLETKIDRVVVYLDGARIYRSGSIELKKGFQQIRIKKLTKNLKKDSVRVSGKGKGSIGAIDVETVYQEEVSHEELNRLVQEEKKLRKELQVLQQKYDFTVKQNDRIKNLSEKFSIEFPQWLASGETQLTTLSTFIDFENKNNIEYLKKKQTLEDEIEELNRKLQTLQNQISIYQNQSRAEQTYEVAIGVDVAQTGPFIFELSYQTVGVSWTPTYDVDLKVDKAVLKGMAQVVNRTLEDWIDVSLEISTAVFKPLRVIEPSPFYINIYDPYARPPPSPGYAAKAKKMAGAPMAMESRARDEEKSYPEEPMVEMYEPTAELKESPSGVQSFEISGKWTIPSDGNNHPITLTTHELKTDKEFYWSSTDGLGVIAQDKITNGDAVILAGNAKVYSEGEFIGETYIAKIAPGEEFKLGAREEMKIKAEKKLLKRIREKAGVVKGKRNIYYEYELIIKNFRKEDSFIVIKDVIPYSRSERIKVKSFESNITPTKDNLGIYTWEMTVKPGAETKIEYRFEVEWEKDFEITPSLP